VESGVQLIIGLRENTLESARHMAETIARIDYQGWKVVSVMPALDYVDHSGLDEGSE